MLSHPFNAKKHGIGGWFLSEKIDGQRAFWDGGISRGLPKVQVPWANNKKDERLLKVQISTGLWSRSGNVIHAPKWWLDKLPPFMLDGELWHGVRGHGQLQVLRKIVAKHVPGPGWKRVRYHVFDIPSKAAIFRDGRLSNPHFSKIFKGIRDWKHSVELAYNPSGLTRFEKIYKEMQKRLTGDVAICHGQQRLPFQTSKAMAIVAAELERICDLEGEGLMLRKPESFWQPKRNYNVLKVKKFDDAEGTVIGYVTGRATDKGSKLLGLMGALVINYVHPKKGNKRLEISGFTDAERELEGFDEVWCTGVHSATSWAELNPGQEVPGWVSAVHFPRGSTVTFRHRGWSLDGIPSIATYWRKRDE
jgi:DNA ligase-1